MILCNTNIPQQAKTTDQSPNEMTRYVSSSWRHSSFIDLASVHFELNRWLH